jgi:protein-tyrosine-phosphatase/predicted ATP-grasp superfamily ATP-dependent carboligase
LILGASARVSLPIARSLHSHGIAVDIASFQPEEADIHSTAVRQFHRLPSRRQNPEAFAIAFLALLRNQQFDQIMPAGDPPLAALGELYDQLGPLQAGCPRPRPIERVLNKSLTLEIAERCGIRVPFTRRIASITELDAVAPQLRFPLVAKPEKKGAGAGAFRIFYFNTLAELSSALKKHDWGGVLLQEYCPGVGMGVELLIHKGECIAQFQHRRIREAPATGGVAVLAISEEPDPQLQRSSIALLRALEWEGVAMVEFRIEPETRTAVLMEVNGRFWGSVSLPIMAGVDFPFYQWQLWHGEQPQVPQPYKVGLRWRWSPGYLDRIQSGLYRKAVGSKPSRLREFLPVPAEFSPFIREALWSWSDPLPFFAEWGRAIKILLSNVWKSLSRRLLPRRLKSYAGIYSRLDPAARPAYMRLRVRDAFRLGISNGMGNREVVAGNGRSFLFVCFGNLMRSPMAEAMLKRALDERGIKNIVVRSAGLHALAGREAHPWALAVAKELGMPLDQHRAQVVTPELISGSDAIFAMDFENLAELNALYPTAKPKIFLLSKFAGERMRNREIPDPYFGDLETTRQCYSLLSQCIANLASEIESLRFSRETFAVVAINADTRGEGE